MLGQGGGAGTCTLVWDSTGTSVYDTKEFGGSDGTRTDAGTLEGNGPGARHDKMAIFSHPEHRHASTYKNKRME